MRGAEKVELGVAAFSLGERSEERPAPPSGEERCQLEDVPVKARSERSELAIEKGVGERREGGGERTGQWQACPVAGAQTQAPSDP